MAKSESEVVEALKLAREKCLDELATGSGKTVEWEFGGQRQKSTPSLMWVKQLDKLIEYHEGKVGSTDRRMAVIRPRGPF